MKSESPPKLAPPGAGLPKIELFFARILFGRFRRKMSPGQCAAMFETERDEVLRLVASRGPGECGRQVLIKRLPGLEDSSRFWSVYMTVEHLRIVNESVAGVIRGLTTGQVPPGAASTAAVKPREGIGPEVVERFTNGCRDYLGAVAPPLIPRAGLTFPHPWFGPLDAASWQAMAAFHMRLHRKQIEKILEALSAAALRT